ncbi:MAG: prepilin-type N-terminal cleavage/methylation domain-containing protein [Alphaproteobacteria bacterium]|nr:prepilin-type N-terminal cleavage/methylation domain-containing protein [Alphaproteobacteria bacterium]
MERVKTKLRNGQQGFTLVELAIVMIIIGLLITGVLKGQEMIANAQVTSTAAQMKAVDAATSTFRDTFNMLPGDIDNIAIRLPAVCTAALCAATDGNANGIVDPDPGAALAAADEMGVYFMHLAAVDLISGVNPSATVFTAAGKAVFETEIDLVTLRVGFNPSATLPTGTTAILGGATTTWRQGHYLTVGSNLADATTGAITPIQAQRLDNKLDDGNPLTGSMRAGGAATCVDTGIYNGNSVNPDCTLYLRIQG